MKKLSNKFVAVMALLGGVSSANTAFAEENVEVQKPVAVASWLAPVASERPDWFDSTPANVRVPGAKVLAIGSEAVLLQRDNEVIAHDLSLREIGVVLVPENTQWLGLDEHGRIFAYDGEKLLFAQSIQDAMRENGFMSVLQLANVQKLDNVDATLVYADKSDLYFSNLDTLANTRFELANFFDDAKMASLTPEAIAEAATAKKPAKKAKTAAKAAPAAEPGAMLDIEVQALVARHDNTVVIRVRRMLDTRVFVTRDGGISWRAMPDAPLKIERELGWIWDGQSKVLDADGKQWLDVCMTPVDWLGRLGPTNMPWQGEPVQLDAHYPASPVAPKVETPSEGDETSTAEATDTTADAEKSAETSAPTCVEVTQVPIFVRDGFVDEGLSADFLHPNGTRRHGVRYFFTNEGNVDGSKVQLWKLAPADVKPEKVALPAGCDPVYVDSHNGLATLICRREENPNGYLTVYSRMATTDWFAEAMLSPNFAIGTDLQMAEDGTVMLSSSCIDEDVPEVPAVFDEAGNVVQEAKPATKQNVCEVAVRKNVAVGEPEAWRIETLSHLESIQPMDGGNLLALTRQSDNVLSLGIVENHQVNTLVEGFDALPYDGVLYTKEGCFALYDRTAPDDVRLLTANGTLATEDCASSREITIKRAEEAALAEVNKDVGDNHYGLRLGAGAFFATGVQTWSMRIEGLFPIYGGQYEIGAVFRMAGGNVSSAMGYLGLITARWRYDQFELFDFAVGAGIGYGQMTGHVAESEPSLDKEGNPVVDKETGEIVYVDTKKSANYRKTNTASIRYLISGIAAYKINPNWKIYLGVELLGGVSWGFDLNAGIEMRF